MFVIEGMEKVRDVIEKNRKRKLAKHKKLSNNTIIEIDNCSPLEVLKLQKNLLQIAEQEHITFGYGKGKRKPEIQHLYEELEACGERLMGYKECFEIMGKDRNSNSKTELEATFMRMKEDHMLKGQLKAAYNIQIAVENYFIVQAYVSNDRTGYNTLISVLEKHRDAFGDFEQLKAAYNIQIAVENYFIVQAYVSNDRTGYNTLISVLEKHRDAFGDFEPADPFHSDRRTFWGHQRK